MPEWQTAVDQTLTINAVAVTGEGNVIRNATGYDLRKLKRAIPHRVRGLREPSFRPPFERISDPQIPLKRH